MFLKSDTVFREELAVAETVQCHSFDELYTLSTPRNRSTGRPVRTSPGCLFKHEPSLPTIRVTALLVNASDEATYSECRYCRQIIISILHEVAERAICAVGIVTDSSRCP